MTNHEPPRLSRRTVLTALGAVPLAVGGLPTVDDTAAATTGSVPDELRPGGTLDRFVAGLAAEDAFSGTVLLVHRNRPVLTRAYGMANKTARLPNRPDTIFAVASITKLFTQVAVDQLARQGKVRHDDTLGTYLDGFPAEIAGTVTIEQLLTHTSGMGDFHQEPGFLDEARTWDTAEEVMNGVLAYVRRGALSFPPQYSNSGYVALGAIVAEVSGQPYHDYVREHVFRPAGMTSSDFYTIPRWCADRRIARPYTTSSGQHVDAVDQHLYIGTPAGGAFANGADLVRFVHTFMGDRGVNAHGGARGGGVCADLDSYPDTGWVTAILSNHEDATQAIDALARRIITGR
jgi:CubicO group peptidase (beta-lactamase class C family)